MELDDAALKVLQLECIITSKDKEISLLREQLSQDQEVGAEREGGRDRCWCCCGFCTISHSSKDDSWPSRMITAFSIMMQQLRVSDGTSCLFSPSRRHTATLPHCPTAGTDTATAG